jgi:hypothetical protein
MRTGALSPPPADNTDSQKVMYGWVAITFNVVSHEKTALTETDGICAYQSYS